MRMIATTLMLLEMAASRIGCLVRLGLPGLMLLEIEVSRISFRCRLTGSLWAIAALWAIAGGRVWS
jgi:hypothetical protein